MMKLRKSQERGHANHGWLDSRHTFSFASYYDPAHMHFRKLRVINDDRVAPGGGFASHPHENMEIISYIVEGTIEHKDSMGNTHALHRGEVQRMSAGTGIVHSEYNPSDSEPLRFLQIWIMPDEKDLQPEYEQIRYTDRLETNRPCLLVSPQGRDGSMKIHQDASLYLLPLAQDGEYEQILEPGRHAWIQVVDGELAINDIALSGGDGLAVSQETALRFHATRDSELLIFDLG